jgi:hypothetical protein
MKNNPFHPAGTFFAGALLASSACSLNTFDLPPGQVLCKSNSDCPTGSRCEFVEQDAAPIDIRVCCVTPGCSQHMSPDALGNAAAAAGYVPDDASSDGDIALDGRPK